MVRQAGQPQLSSRLYLLCVWQISDIQVSGQSEDMTAKEKLLLWSQRMVEGGASDDYIKRRPGVLQLVPLETTGTVTFVRTAATTATGEEGAATPGGVRGRGAGRGGRTARGPELWFPWPARTAG